MVDLKFDEDGLIPVVTQETATGQVLMAAYMTREALLRTVESGDAWYWSRSRNTLWRKGEQSGHTQRVKEVRVDCDGDVLLLLVDQVGAACHTGHHSCFYRTVDGQSASESIEGPSSDILDDLSVLLKRRQEELPEGSYSASLFRAGRAVITAKVKEESEELIRAAGEETDQRVVEEAADLLYHAMVLLVDRGIALVDVRRELERRRHGR